MPLTDSLLAEDDTAETPKLTPRAPALRGSKPRNWKVTPEALDHLDALANMAAPAKAATPEQTKPKESIGLLGTLKQGAKGTLRALGATVDTAQGDEAGVVNAAKEQAAVEKDPDLADFYAHIDERKKALTDPSLWEGIKAVGSAALKNPRGFGLMIAEQAPSSVAALGAGGVGALAGSAFGPVGTVIGGIGGLATANIGLETGHKALEAGADGSFGPTEQSQVRKEGLIKGATITGVNIPTLGMTKWITGTTRRAVERATTKTLSDAGVDVTNAAARKAALTDPVIKESVTKAQELAKQASNTLGKRLARTAGAVGLETVGEGAGEYLGEFAATGKPNTIEAVIEAFAGFGQSAGEIAITSALNRQGMKRLFDNPETAEKTAAAETKKTGIPYEAIPHPTEPDKYVAVPKTRSASGIEFERDAEGNLTPISTPSTQADFNLANKPGFQYTAEDKIREQEQEKAREAAYAANPIIVPGSTTKAPVIAGKPVTDMSNNALIYTVSRGSARAQKIASDELARRDKQGIDPSTANAPETPVDTVNRIIATGAERAKEDAKNTPVIPIPTPAPVKAATAPKTKPQPTPEPKKVAKPAVAPQKPVEVAKPKPVVQPTNPEVMKNAKAQPIEKIPERQGQGRHEEILPESTQGQKREIKAENTSQVVLPDNTSLPAYWDVVDADSVKATIKEGKNQPRDRSRAASDVQVQGIANNPDYRRLADSPVMDVGAPTLSHDGLIVGGNGRFEGISRAYDQSSANDYLTQLKVDAATKGIDPAKLESMKKPVLVRRITQPFDVRKLAIASNSGSGLQYSGMELAKIDAERMKGLEHLEVTDTGDIALTGSNIQNVRHALGGYSAAELGSLTDKNGQLSQEGVRRIRNAMLYSAYGSNPTLERLVESTDNDLRNISGALVKAAGSAAKVRADIKAGNLPAELDISESIVGAVETLSKIKSQGMTVDEYLAQNGLFGEEVNEDTREILRVLEANIRSQRKIADFIRTYYETVSRIDISTDDIFGANIPTKPELLKNAKARITETAPETSDLFAKANKPIPQPSPESPRKPADNARAKDSGTQDQVKPAPKPKDEGTGGAAPAAPKVANPIRDLIESLIKRRAAARQIGKERTFDKALTDAKAMLAGEKVSPARFKNAAKLFANDKATADILTTLQAKAEEANKAAKAKPAFSRSKAPAPKSQSRARVESIINSIKAKWKNAPEVVVIDSITDAPADVQEENNRQLSMGASGEPEGFISGNKVYIVASQMKTPGDVVRVLLHESLGHFGLRGVFGAELQTVLRQVAAMRPRDMETKAQQYGLDLSNEEDRLTAAEEILAEMAQTNPQSGIVRRAIAAINKWLRMHILGFQNLRLSDSEIIQDILIPARQFVENGSKRNSDGKIAFKRVFHGTPHIWPPEPGFPHGRPRLDKMGSGEGSQAYGWGWYSAEDEGTADYYQKTLGMLRTNTGEVLLRHFPDRHFTTKERAEVYSSAIGDNPIDVAARRLGYRRASLREVNESSLTEAIREIRDTAKGNLYHLDIPDSVLPHLLDWDKPLSEQTPEVRKALKEYAGTVYPDGRVEGWAYGGNPSGRDIYEVIAQEANDYDANRNNIAGAKYAAEKLASLGIVGNRYLDGGSRADGKGTYNYVIWDQPTLDKIALLERNGDKLDAIRKSDAAFSRATSNTANTHFSRSPAAIQSAIRGRIDKISDSLIYNFQDRFKPLKDIQERTGPVAEDEDAALAEERYSGMVRARTDAFEEQLRDPLLKAIHDSGVAYDDVEKYLHALHAPSRNAAMREINPTEAELKSQTAALEKQRDSLAKDPDVTQYLQLRRELRDAEADIEDGIADESLAVAIKRDIAQVKKVQNVTDYTDALDKLKALRLVKPFQGDNTALSGMSDAEARAILDKIDANGTRKALERVSALVDDITSKTRQIYVDSGLEKANVIDAWNNKYEHYVPLHRDEVSGNTMPRIGQGFNIKGKESKRATGSTKDVTNILAHVVAQHEAAIIRSEKAKVDRALFTFAQRNPDPSLWTLDEAPMLRTVDPNSGLVVERVDPTYKNRPEVLTLKIDGEEHTITFNDKNEEAMRLAASMKNLGADQLGEVTQMVGKITRFLAMMNTTANPVFTARNFLRDLQTAYVNLSDTAVADKKAAVFRDVRSAIRGMWDLSRGKKTSQWAKYAQEFKDAGGQTGWMEHYKDIGERADKIKKELEAMKPGKMNLAMRTAREWGRVISDANNAVENGVRLSAYVQARKSGLSEAKAAQLAKNLTVNFNARGAQSVQLNSWYMFMNASIQGTARLVKAMGNKQVRKIVAGVILSGFLMDILARSMAGDDDDDGENDYDQLPEHVKAMNFVFMVNNRPVTIPMPYGYNFFASTGRKISEIMFRPHYSPVKSAADLTGVFLDAFSPTGQAGSFLQYISPTVTDPLVQWSENKNFAGNPLRRPQSPFGVPNPEYQMGFKSTSAPAKWLAEMLNNETGGNEVRPGFVNVNPAFFDFAVSSIAGGAGRTYLQTLSGPMKSAQGEDIKAKEVPFLNIFLGAKPEYQTEKKYFDAVRAVETAKEELKTYRQKGDAEMVKQILEDHGHEIRLQGAAKETKNLLARLKKRDIALDKTNPPNKRELRKQIEDQRREAMARFNKKYRQAVEAH